MGLDVFQESRQPRKGRRIKGASPTSQADGDGLPLAQYARHHGLSISEVWAQVRSGALIGRSHGGRILVYSDESRASRLEAPRVPIVEAKTVPDALPALPEPAELAPISGHTASAEVMLLMEELTLTRQASLETVRVTEMALSRITAVTDQLLASKDELLAQKSATVLKLEAELAERSKAEKALKQRIEDLEMLSSAL